MTAQIIKGSKNDWQIVIGLEVHAQILSESKLFSNSPTNFGADANSQVSFIDSGMPGMLPALNKKCVEQTIKTGLALNAQINLYSQFDRKNYFYADLPTGYQISQYKYPIVGEGSLTIAVDGSDMAVRIERIHLEQDAGKSLHDQSPSETFIDLNRAGVGLMEIVTKPDMRSSGQAASFMKKLRLILKYLGTCDGNMEEGSLRCDANVSVNPIGSEAYGTRVEVKNLNSVKHLMKAIEFEAKRQVEVLENGGTIIQETRLFDPDSSELGETRAMRSKEDAHDYRYFPDPDLLPLILTIEQIHRIKSALPELPDQKKERYMNQFGLSMYDAEVITAEKATTNYFEEVIKNADHKLAANWITAELFGKLNKFNISIENSPISASDLGELINLISNKTISGKIAKQVFEIMFKTQEKPMKIVSKHNLHQVTDTTLIEDTVLKVIFENPDKVQEYRSGKDKLFPFFVGQVMKLTQGKANPESVTKILKQHL